MNKVIEFKTEAGESVWVELDETQDSSSASGAEMQSVSSKDVKKVEGKFENALGTLKTVATAVIQKLDNITNAPDQVEVKVGLKFNIEAGVIIAKTSTEGNLSVTMRWERNKT